LNRYAVKQSRGLDGPFIFTSASCAIHARIQAAGNRPGNVMVVPTSDRIILDPATLKNLDILASFCK
jgi:hypothetical protein